MRARGKSRCDVCGRPPHRHGKPIWTLYAPHAYVCSRDDALREVRLRSREGARGHEPLPDGLPVDRCMYEGCVRGRHEVWSIGHEYEPPSDAVLLERMRVRRGRRLAAGRPVTRSHATVYHVWVEEPEEYDPFDEVGGLYADLSTAIRVTRNRLGISPLVAPLRRNDDTWSLHCERAGITALVRRRSVRVPAR